MNRSLRALLATGILIILFCGGSVALGKPPVKQAPEAEATLEQTLIDQNILISEWFDGVAESIDFFLVGEKSTKNQNQTRITVENTSYSRESEDLRNNTSIGVFPRFPNLEKYWALKFTTYDEKEARRGIKENFVNKTTRRKNYGATVAWYRKFGSVRTSFEPRIELQDPLRISHSLTFDSSAKFEEYEIRPKLELYTSARRGPGFFEALDFVFFLNKDWTLTLINQGDYLDQTRTYTANNGFSIGHEISKKSVISYGLIFSSTNRPNYHLASYVASVSFNEILYKKVLDYTITPYLEFSETQSFKGEVGGVLNIRLTF